MYIRSAQVADAQAIADIYNDAVLNTTAIWNETCVDAASREQWLRLRQEANFPVIVAADEADNVLGYGSFGDWRAWDGYRYTVEHSVYVDRRARGQGVGIALMQKLTELAGGQGKHVMIAAIESGNLASIALHKRLGFIETGHLPQVGCKSGRWLDLTFMQLRLDERPAP